MLVNRVSVLIFITLFFSACQTLSPTEELGARVGIKIVVKKFIDKGDRVERATKILKIVNKSTDFIEAAETHNLAVLEAMIRADINWSSLDQDETDLMDGLIIIVREYLEDRIEATDGLSAAEALSVKKVFSWIAQAAQSKLDQG